MTAAEFVQGLEAVRRNGDGYVARCPAHDDRTPSLSVKDGDEGGVVLYCHAKCAPEAVCAAHGYKLRDLAPPDPGGNGSGRRRLVATYRYEDAHGQHQFDVVRFDPKAFRQRRPDGNGGWIWNLKGVTRVLYQLPDVVRTVRSGGAVWVCEGEKDCDRLNQVLAEVGAVATTNPAGAGKWRSEYNETLKDANVVIVADQDEPGRDHAETVAKQLEGVAASVCIVAPVEGKDASDHLAAGRRLGEFRQVSARCADPKTQLTQLGGSRGEGGLSASLRPPIGRSDARTQFTPDAETASDPDALHPFAVSLGEFIDMPRTAAAALAADTDGRPLIAHNSLVMLGARGGRGKTTHFIDWMVHLALGEDYLCFTIPLPARILVIENEGPEEQFAEKLAARVAQLPPDKQRLVRDRVHVYVLDWGGFNLGDPDVMSRLVAYLDEHEFDLIFGDPLDALGIEGVGSPEDTRKFLGLMKQAGLNKRNAWWLNTHPRKEETREAIDEIAGSWGGKPDTIMLLDLLPDDRSRIRFPKIRWAKRGKRPSILLAFDADTETFSYLREESEEERNYAAEIAALLGDGTWRTVKEIAAPKDADKPGIGASETTVKKELDAHPDRFVSRTGADAAAVGRSRTATVWLLTDVEAER